MDSNRKRLLSTAALPHSTGRKGDSEVCILPADPIETPFFLQRSQGGQFKVGSDFSTEGGAFVRNLKDQRLF